jgi:outer membrane protein
MGPVQFDGSWLYIGQLNLSQLVFDGGRTLAQIAAARAQVAQSAQDRATQQLAVEATVTAAYFAALEAEAQLFVTKQFETQQTAQATIIRKLQVAGIRKEMDALAAEARARRATYDRVRAEGAIGVRRAALIAAMGVQQDSGFTLVDTATNAPAEEKTPIEDLVTRAWTTRPEIRSLEALQRAAREQVRAARSDYFPSMSLGLSAWVQGNTAATTGLTPLFDLFGTLTLQEQLFTGLSTFRSTQAARATLEVARAKLESMRAAVRGAVVSAYRSLMMARDAEKEAVALVERTEKLTASAQRQYDAGYLTMLELYDAQSQRVTALGLRVTAHYDVALARTDLRRAMGGTILEGDVLK